MIMKPTYDAVLFDWCGTLVGYPSPRERFRSGLDALGRPVDENELQQMVDRYTAAEQHSEAIRTDASCDLSREDHREARLTVFEIAGFDKELAQTIESMYGDLATYEPYPEVVPLFEKLAEHDVSIAIVSDFHVDLRPHFEAIGVDDLIAGYAISFEVGVTKPDPRMFEVALRAVGCSPSRALMVGDRSHPDGGGAAVGIDCVILPVRTRLTDHRLDAVDRLTFG